MTPQQLHHTLRAGLREKGPQWLDLVRGLEEAIARHPETATDRWLPVRLYLNALEALYVDLPSSYKAAVQKLKDTFHLDDVVIRMPRGEEGSEAFDDLGTAALTDPHQGEMQEALHELRALVKRAIEEERR